jgi:hypothetical protein
MMHETRPVRASSSLASIIAFFLSAGCGLAASGRADADGTERPGAPVADSCEPEAECAPAADDTSPPGSPPSEGDPAPQAGGGNPEQSPPLAAEPERAARCGTRRIANQATLDTLEGCAIVESLGIEFGAADLRPLHALQRVEGDLWLKGQPEASVEAGIASLEGLEQLEEVGGTLLLESLAAPTLAPLRNLRRVGGIAIRYLSNLRNLDGLENLLVYGIPFEATENPNLATLDPLVVPRDMGRGLLHFGGNAALSDLGALGSLEIVDTLLVTGTALTQLDALSNLRRVASVEVSFNPALADARGLAGLESTRALYFTDNAAIESLPAFERMVRAGLVVITGNAKLSAFPAFPQLEQLASDFSGRLVVEDNPSLAELRGLDVLASVDAVSIRRNASLTRIELPALHDVYQSLVVTSNPALDAPSLAALTAVVAPFAKIAGNEPDAALLDPCPWPTDGECDAAPAATLCAADTDELDCSMVR